MSDNSFDDFLAYGFNLLHEWEVNENINDYTVDDENFNAYKKIFYLLNELQKENVIFLHYDFDPIYGRVDITIDIHELTIHKKELREIAELLKYVSVLDFDDDEMDGGGCRLSIVIPNVFKKKE